MPLQATSGAASYDAFGGGVAVVPNYIEECFSCFLYTGNGATQTINNGIDLAGKGGLVWTKGRSGSARSHYLNDSARGIANALNSNTTSAQDSRNIASFNSNGYTTNPDFQYNASGETFVSWTFREQPKFFDVVTYTGDGGGSDQVINHNLGSTPGCIIVKASNASQDWLVWHRATGNSNDKLFLNRTDAVLSGYGNGVQNVTSTSFIAAGNTTVNNPNYDINIAGRTYVAYLFAHNAGGFGLTGTDNVISCGSYTGNGTTGLAVPLGYEPQWVMVKCSSAAQADGWIMVDNMRGMDNTGNQWLKANTSGAESAESARIIPTATGFTLSSNPAVNTNGATYIYIAIRRGPMKVPTTGTSVFAIDTATTTNSPPLWKSNFPVDLGMFTNKTGYATNVRFGPRLTSVGYLVSSSSAAETTGDAAYKFDYQNGYYNVSFTDSNFISWMFRRAPGFFDVVCYTGTGAARTVAHNLGVAPELMIVKNRTTAVNWNVYHAALGNTQGIVLNAGLASAVDPGFWNDTSPTASVFTVGTNGRVNTNSNNYVNYLFATCPGVSKVGSYTGTGTTQTINCGFTGGARFVMIKRTDSTGDWYVWDSARGIVAGNDPYLLLNSTAAEVTSTDFVDTAATGFELSSTAPAALNASGGTYIFLAIA